MNVELVRGVELIEFGGQYANNQVGIRMAVLVLVWLFPVCIFIIHNITLKVMVICQRLVSYLALSSFQSDSLFPFYEVASPSSRYPNHLEHWPLFFKHFPRLGIPEYD